MNRIARLIGLTLVLLLIFLAAVIASSIRLRRQSELAQKAALETRQQQLVRALAVTRPSATPWPESYLNDLSTILDARVTLLTDQSLPNKSSAPKHWYFDHLWQDATGQSVARLRVEIAPPTALRLGQLFRHTALALLCLALGLLILLILVLIFRREKAGEAEKNTHHSSGTRHSFESLSQLAKVSVKQQAELEQERIERLRATEDLHFQQILLNRSLEEKIHLGRELHDGIIQSLYATGLTFEVARKHLTNSPEDAARQLDTGLKALNATIRDVRSYISGLAPENLRQQSFSEAAHALTESIRGGRAVSFDLRIDESAAARLDDAHITNLLQIIRESISNSLRHGAATQITVRLHESGDELALLIQDNGKGFDPARLAARGHGLDNIQARADRIAATLRLTSAPGDGTRILITLPISASPTT